MSSNNDKPKNKNISQKIEIINKNYSKEEQKQEYENLEEKIYNISYQKGRAAMLNQMGRPDLIGKTSEYTDSIEIPKEEQEKYERIMDKAYVDGYHKAANIVVCPRTEH